MPNQRLKLFYYEMMKVMGGEGSPPFEYYDLDLDKTAFSEMVVTPSPQITSGNRILLNVLLEKYNPTAVVQESKLLGLI